MATKFRYPTGARPLLIDETARRRRIETRFVSMLEESGFAEVVLPIIDFAEPYAPLTGRDAARQSYRFTDREGELVAIRSDFTPMVARALAPAISTSDLPLRVFYRGDVIRCEATRLGANRELFQIGAEIVGDGSSAADIEILRLSADLAEAFGVRPLVVYNDASIVSRFDAATRAALKSRRIHSGLPPLARRLIGGEATLDDVRAFDAAAAQRLEAIGAAFEGDTRFALHLDDLDDLDTESGYYTGLRFRVYGGDGLRKRVAQGGRYDTLYGWFGSDAPAIGFTFTIDDLSAEPSSALDPSLVTAALGSDR